jgi:hypothetical protein
MKVVCIDKYGWKYLTEGKTYKVTEITEYGNYWIIDDYNHDLLCLNECFKTLSEIRNEKIDKLLGI